MEGQKLAVAVDLAEPSMQLSQYDSNSQAVKASELEYDDVVLDI